MTDNLQRKTGEASEPVDFRLKLREFIVEIDENIIKKLDNHDEREKFTYDTIDNFMKLVAELKGKLGQFIFDRTVVGKNPFEVLLNGLRDAEIPLGEARKLVEINKGMTKQSHRSIVRAIRSLESALKKVR